MPERDNAIEWDFRTLIDGWILYGLPVLLVVVAIGSVIRARSRAQSSASVESKRTVRRIGLIHGALAVQALIFLVQELLTMRTMGIPESHISLVVGVITTVVNPVLAVGLLCLSSIVRRLALAWYTLLSVIAVMAMLWLYYYRVPIDPVRWPEQMASKVMPIFLLVVMLLPRIRRVFAKPSRVEPPNEAASRQEAGTGVAEAPIGWRVISIASLLFLIVVCSNLVVDATDWGYRLAFEFEPVP